MANIFLDNNEKFTVFGGDDNKIFGKSGNGTEKVTLLGGATGVVTDANVEAIEFGAASGDYTYQQEGNSLSVFDGNTKVANIPLQIGSADTDDDGTLITFTNGTFSAKFDTTDGSVSLGGSTVPSDNPGAVDPEDAEGPAVTITTDVQSVDEGDSVTATFKSDANTTIDYTIAGIDAADLDGNTALSGTITTDADGSATLTLDLAEDQETEGVETLTITGKLGDSSDDASVTVNDTSKAPPTTLTVDKNTIDEGGTVTASVTGAKAGATLSYSITGVAAADIDKPLTGTVTADDNGAASLVITALEDQSTEGLETLTLTIDGNSADVAINDTSKDAKIFTLTSGQDTGEAFLGSESADTYNAPLLTVNSGDSLDGAGGVDTLNATINSDVLSSFTAKNIENVSLTSLGGNSVDMTNIAEATKLINTGSTGQLTLSNIADADLIMAFKGDGQNDTVANYATGGIFGSDVLSGSSDDLNVEMDGANQVRLDVDSGFESATITNKGTSDIDNFTLPGVSEFVLQGSGELDIAAGAITGFELISGASYTGGLTTGVVQSNGFVNGAISGSANGATLLLGSGVANIGYQQQATAGNSDTVRLGAGNDVIDVTALGAGDLFLFGEDGNDLARVSGALTASDLINMGAGTADRLVLTGTNANTLVSRGLERVSLGVGSDLDVSSADSALAITASAGADNVVATNLSGGSTLQLVGAGMAQGLTLSFRANEASTTVDVDSGLNDTTSGLSISNVQDITLDLARGADFSTKHTNVNGATGLTINSSDSLQTGDINAGTATERLASLKITGSDSVSVGEINNDARLATVDIAGTQATTLGQGADAIDDATDLTSLKVTSSSSSVSIGDIEQVTQGASITATAATTATLTTIGAANSSTNIGNVAVTAGNGLLTFDTITSQNNIGDLVFKSTKGAIEGANITSSDAGGVTASFNAATQVGDNGGAFTVQNTGGDVTVIVSGATSAEINGTAVTSGVANLTATNTGGLDVTLTNAATEGDGDTATITLGNAKLTTKNVVTVAGTVDKLNITGGSGVDELDFSDGIDIQSGTINLGSGEDLVDFEEIDDTLSDDANGVIVNLSSSAVTFDVGTNDQSAVDAGEVAEYDANKDETGRVVVKDELDLNLVGVENVIGTEHDDYLVASNTGSELDGGDGADTLVGGVAADELTGGAGADTITGGAGADTIELGTGDAVADLVSLVGINTAADADTIYDFTTTDDEVALTNTAGVADGTDAGALVNIAGIGGLTIDDVIADTAANLGAGAVNVGDQSATFTSGGYAFETDTGKLYFDADGDFTAGVVQVATIFSTANGGADTAAVMAAGDFQFG